MLPGHLAAVLELEASGQAGVVGPSIWATLQGMRAGDPRVGYRR